METPEFARASLRDFLHVLFKRKTQILLFFLVTFCTVAIATFVIKPTYEAKAHILVKVGRESMYVPATGSGNPVINMNREEQINSEIEILKGRSLIQDVVTALGPATIYPGLDTDKKGILATLIPDRSRQDKTPAEKALLELQNDLAVYGIKKSNIIEISFKHNVPQIAAVVVNTLAEFYLDQHVNVHKASHSYEFFQHQSNFLKNKLSSDEFKLKDLKEKYNVTALDEQQKILLQRAQDLRMALNLTESEIVGTESRILLLDQQLKALPKTTSQGEIIDQNPYIINTLEARLVELQLKEKNLRTKYTAQNRLVKNVRDEIKVVQQKLASQEKKSYGSSRSGVNPTYRLMHENLLGNKVALQALKAEKVAQTTQLAKYHQELEAFNKIEMLHDQLEQEVDVDRQNYRLYLTKFEESRISDAMDTEKMISVSLIEPAQKPLDPMSPKKLLNLVLGLFLGACGGLGLAFLLEYLDDSLEKVEDVENILQLPVLAAMPELEQ